MYRRAREMMAAPTPKLAPAEQAHLSAYQERQRAALRQLLFWWGLAAIPALFLVWMFFFR